MRTLIRMEYWPEVKKMKFNRDKCKVLYLGNTLLYSTVYESKFQVGHESAA